MKQPGRYQSSGRWRGRGAPGARAENSLQPMEKTMMKQVVLMQSVEDMPEQISMLQPVENPHSNRWI